MENYLKIANKLLRGITDTDLLKSEIWNDIVSKVKAKELELWEINNEILRLKYLHADIIALASSFACSKYRLISSFALRQVSTSYLALGLLFLA